MLVMLLAISQANATYKSTINGLLLMIAILRNHTNTENRTFQIDIAQIL